MSAHRIKNFRLPDLRVLHIGLLGIVLFFVGIVVYIFTHVSLWDGETKLSYVVNRQDSVDVVVVDPMYKEVTTIVIPGDTMVEMARGLGETKIKNVYSIGVNENLDGQLFYETVSYYLALPAYHYVNDSGLNYASDSFFDGIQTIFSASKTSFSLTEKVKLFLFSWTNRDIKRVTINLNQTSYLRKIILTDGTEGYIKTPFMPQSIQSLFDVNIDAGEIFTVSIVNYSGTTVNMDKMSNTYASLGGKVISVKEKDDSKKAYSTDNKKIFCEINIKDKTLGNEIKKYFQMCQTNISDLNEKSIEMEVLTLE